MDQLQLPADVVGQLLLLLQDVDIQCVRLVCKSWKQAVDHQLRTIRPLYLPPSTAAVFSNCSSLQVQLLRRVDLAGATDAAGPVPKPGFSWRAPLRNFPTLSGTAPHTAELDLSGQRLPADCIAQLAQHFTRLSSLRLDGCTLLESALCDLDLFPTASPAATDATAIGRDSGLHRLSLAGVRTCTELQESSAESTEHGPAELTDILDAIATNPLTHLDLCSWGNMVSARKAWCWRHLQSMLHAVLHVCIACLPQAPCSYSDLHACIGCPMYMIYMDGKCKRCTCRVIKGVPGFYPASYPILHLRA